MLRANADIPKMFAITAEGTVEIAAAESAADGKPKVRSFSMVAYTGGPMQLAGFYWPVIVDLTGVQVKSQQRPILFGHDLARILGHSQAIEVSAQRIKVSGMLSGVGEDVTLVTSTADNGFPWQASIGAQALQMEFVDRGNTVKVNGRNFDGPVYVARKTSLREISFVALGADDNTTASIAANIPSPVIPPTPPRGSTMNFSQWLQAAGLVEADLTENQLATLRAAFEAQYPKGTPAPTNPGTNPGPAPQLNSADIIAQIRKDAAAESERVSSIRQICARYEVPTVKVTGDDGKDIEVQLEAHAISKGWDANQTELHALRASRPKGPAIHVAMDTPRDAIHIEAALSLTAGLPNIEKHYKPEVLEAASSKLRGFGLQQLLILAAAANGYVSRPGERIHAGNLRTVMQYAFNVGIQAASSMSLTNILSNVANKELLVGYNEGGEQWREIAEVKPVSDFKQVTSYRLLDNFEYEEIGPDGQIKHGSVGEESYTRQAKTYAKMFALTRTDMINDDLGAFSDVRTRLGRGAKKKFNNIFWAAFINNSTFFTTARTNYIEGATTNLGFDGVGLGLGVLACSKMTSPAADGRKRVGAAVEPNILVHPPELKTVADTLYAATNLSAVKASDANIHANKYRPVSVPQLSESQFTGNSATAWYLFGQWLKPMVASFLNGNETPTVESADADFDTLGVQFRGYHDFGADKSEYLAGIKSKGAA